MTGDNFARRTVDITRIRIAGEDGPLGEVRAAKHPEQARATLTDP
jgi:hypothetical protein